jgi:electron transport complex protein RnfC
MKLDKAARAINPNELEELHVMNCIECGSCTYVCPAKRYLVQNIRNGKAYVRAEAQAAKENAKKGDSN